jgi:hypothetical protein
LETSEKDSDAQSIKQNRRRTTIGLFGALARGFLVPVFGAGALELSRKKGKRAPYRH